MPADTIKRIFDDLLNLEVNVIVKPDMTARKMPLTGEAFHDIASSYRTYLDQQAVLLDDALEVRLSGVVIDDARVGSDEFRSLAQDATALRRAHARSPILDADGNDEGVGVVLKRIARNSEQLTRIMLQRGIDARNEIRTAHHPAAGVVNAEYSEWTPVRIDDKEDLLILRKAWEMSTESVVMQTVAQVDGDVVTRVQRARAGVDDTPIHHVHMNMVSTALEHWRFLFATVATLATGVLTSFFRS